MRHLQRYKQVQFTQSWTTNKMSLIIISIFSIVLIGNLCGSHAQYTCETAGLANKRVWTTVPSSYTFDTCSQLPLIRSCYGDVCQAYIQCHCFNSTTGKYPPGVQCWVPGEKLSTPDGQCNSAIPIGTAVAFFDPNGKFMVPVCGAFMGCKNSETITLFMQICTNPMALFDIPRTAQSYELLHVVKPGDPLSADLTTKLDCIDQPPALRGCSLDIGLQVCKT